MECPQKTKQKCQNLETTKYIEIQYEIKIQYDETCKHLGFLFNSKNYLKN